MRFMHEDVGNSRRRGTASEQSLAARIRALRKAMKLSQTRFAERIGVDQSNVSRWENGAEP
ncbi:MAG: helix-turn-helix transcriptional regulator, partial [Proteobacteria bacterium]|nr:helix-turn-helix transcriptional regulator [Pseudomonadota bacterium]